MIDEDELNSFYEQGDKLLDSFDMYIAKIRDLKITNPAVTQIINNFVEIIGANMIMLSKVMDDIAELEIKITKDIDVQYLQSIDAIREIQGYIKLKQQEYILRIAIDAKLKETLYKILDIYEDYDAAIERAGAKIEEVSDQEREESKKENAEKKIMKSEQDINRFAELMYEYETTKADKDVTKKGFRLRIIKKKIKDELGDHSPWIDEEFKKHTGDIL
jgi:hypothetical protein